jgi:hypothetical protein
MEVSRNLRHEPLPTLLKAIQESAVTAVQLVERPSRYVKSVAQHAID